MAAVIALILTVSGCKVMELPIPEDSANESDTIPCFAERLVGRYSCETEESGTTVLEIYLIDGNIIAEAEQEYAAYFAAELIADDSAVLYSSLVEQADFTVYAFSGFSNFGEYWDETPKVTLALTEDGVCLTESDGAVVEFVRDDTLEPIHEANRYGELLSELAESPYPEAMLGTWAAEVWGGHRIVLSMYDDGTIVWYCKTEGAPVAAYIGSGAVICGADLASGTLVIVVERIGHANMPWQNSLRYELTSTGLLLVQNSEPDGLLPTDDEVALTQYYDMKEVIK